MRATLKLCLVVPAFCIGCSWFQGHPQATTDVRDVATCVFEGAIAGLSPEAIAVKCGGMAVDDVIQILDEGDKFAHYKAAREKAAVDKAGKP